MQNSGTPRTPRPMPDAIERLFNESANSGSRRSSLSRARASPRSSAISARGTPTAGDGEPSTIDSLLTACRKIIAQVDPLRKKLKTGQELSELVHSLRDLVDGRYPELLGTIKTDPAASRTLDSMLVSLRRISIALDSTTGRFRSSARAHTDLKAGLRALVLAHGQLTDAANRFLLRALLAGTPPSDPIFGPLFGSLSLQQIQDAAAAASTPVRNQRPPSAQHPPPQSPPPQSPPPKSPPPQAAQTYSEPTPEDLNTRGTTAYRRGDYHSAFKAFKAAAAAGHPVALNNLGICYEEGRGTQVDLEAALVSYRASAGLGNPNGAANYGFILAQKGYLDEARLQFEAAAAGGSAKARSYLADLDGEQSLPTLPGS